VSAAFVCGRPPALPFGAFPRPAAFSRPAFVRRAPRISQSTRSDAIQIRVLAPSKGHDSTTNDFATHQARFAMKRARDDRCLRPIANNLKL
jgi:hypothetical protein